MRQWCELFLAQVAYYGLVTGGFLFISERNRIGAFAIEIPTAAFSYFVIQRVATSGSRWLAAAYIFGGAAGTVIAMAVVK